MSGRKPHAPRSIDQAEYSTDLIFGRQANLGAIYDRLTRTAIHTVKPENVATFLGRKLNGNYQDELGSLRRSRSGPIRLLRLALHRCANRLLYYGPVDCRPYSAANSANLVPMPSRMLQCRIVAMSIGPLKATYTATLRALRSSQ